MNHQPKPNYRSCDDVQTPPELAAFLAEHFCPLPGSHVLEPCAGDGNLIRALMREARFAHYSFCEIKSEVRRIDCYFGTFEVSLKRAGTDFLTHAGRADWIVTNPPFSKIKSARGQVGFLEKAFQCADNVVFLLTLNHALGSKSRYRLMDKYSFGIREVMLLDTPPKETGWPQAGFQVGAVHWQREYSGDWKMTDARGKIKYSPL